MLDLGFRILSSTRTTAVLALLFSSTAFIAAAVPQGAEALELAKDPSATRLHQLAVLGLTSIFDSPWFYAILVLFAGNLAAIAIRAFLRSGAPKASIEPPEQTAHEREIGAPRPELAVEVVREVLGRRLGLPRAERVQGARVKMLFELPGAGERGPLLAHLGLMLLVLGAGLFASTEEQKGLPRAMLDVTDTVTHTTGHFDMVAGEQVQFFQWPARYVLRDYSSSHEGLGPAVRLERHPEREQPSDFWIFQNAPAGFDERHRGGEVLIESQWMGLSPLPGRGLAASPMAILMVAGLALLGLGALTSGRTGGRVWVDLEGDRVRLAGIPEAAGDRDFAKDFDRWALLTQSALSEI